MSFSGISSSSSSSVHHDDLPADGLAVARVHAEQVPREERGLLPAGSGANLHHGVAPLKRVGRQKRREHLLLGGLLELVRGPGVVQLLQERILVQDRTVAPAVRQNIRVAHLRFHGRQATQNAFNLVLVDQVLTSRTSRSAS